MVGFTLRPYLCIFMRFKRELTCLWSRRRSAERPYIGMAAVGVMTSFFPEVLVSSTSIISTVWLVTGIKLVKFALRPMFLLTLVTLCHSMPAVTRDSSISPEAADQEPIPFIYTQKLRLYLVSFKSSVETGGVRNVCWSILISPCRVGVMEESRPFSLARGK